MGISPLKLTFTQRADPELASLALGEDGQPEEARYYVDDMTGGVDLARSDSAKAYIAQIAAEEKKKEEWRWANAMMDAIERQREIERMIGALNDIADEYARLAKVQEDKRDFHLAEIEKLKTELKTLTAESNDIRGALVDAKDGSLKDPAAARRALAAIGVGLPENATEADILAAINANRDRLERKDKDITSRIPEINSKIDWHAAQADIAAAEAARLREAEVKVRREIERLEREKEKDPSKDLAKEIKEFKEQCKEEMRLVNMKSDDGDLRYSLLNLQKEQTADQIYSQVEAGPVAASPPSFAKLS